MTAPFDRDKARDVLFDVPLMEGPIAHVLDALAACVVPDPRIARIEARLEREWRDGDADSAEARAAIRAILRGES